MAPSLPCHQASCGTVQRAATTRSDSVGLLISCRPMRPAFAPARPITSFSVPAAQSNSSVACMASKGFGPAKPQAKPKQTTPPTPCTCGSGKAYKRCCEPLHQGTSLADSPEQTLRARFSAYNKEVAQYLLSTTHPDYHTYRFNVPAGTAGDRVEEEVKMGIEKFEYAGLKIIKNEPGSSEDEGFVTFEYVSRKKPAQGQPASENWSKTAEKCRFARVDGKWLFVDYQTYTYDGGVAAAAAAVDKVADVEPLAGSAASS